MDIDKDRLPSLRDQVDLLTTQAASALADFATLEVDCRLRTEAANHMAVAHAALTSARTRVRELVRIYTGDDPRAIYRTVFTVEVFSLGPFTSTDDDNMSDLAAIDDAISEGRCVGHVTETSTEIVPPTEIEGHLERIDNDGSFFDEI